MRNVVVKSLGRSWDLHFLIPPCDVGPIVILYLIQVSVLNCMGQFLITEAYF